MRPKSPYSPESSSPRAAKKIQRVEGIFKKREEQQRRKKHKHRDVEVEDSTSKNQ